MGPSPLCVTPKYDIQSFQEWINCEVLNIIFCYFILDVVSNGVAFSPLCCHGNQNNRGFWKWLMHIFAICCTVFLWHDSHIYHKNNKPSKQMDTRAWYECRAWGPIPEHACQHLCHSQNVKDFEKINVMGRYIMWNNLMTYTMRHIAGWNISVE